MIEIATRLTGSGHLALIGGGEFSFGETAEADALWTELAPDGIVGFLPTASGSTEYGEHLAAYLSEGCDRSVETIPVYRTRDARREKNATRIAETAAVYIGGGIGDQLLETLRDSTALEALEERLRSGGLVVAIAAAAQATGAWARTLDGRDVIPGFGWLRRAVIEPNFLPTHDRRLRQLMEKPGVRYGLGLPAGSSLVVSGDGARRLLGPAFLLEAADGDLKTLKQDAAAGE